MNIWSQIDEFIGKYSTAVYIIAAVLTLIIVILIVKFAVKSTRENTRLLSQLNETVTKINSTVDTIKDREPKVIYIDNRVPEKIEEQKVNITFVDEPEEKSRGETSDDEVMTSKKFFARDCAVSKSGIKYTEAELTERIK